MTDEQADQRGIEAQREGLQRRLTRAKQQAEEAQALADEIRNNVFRLAVGDTTFPPELVKADSDAAVAQSDVDRLQGELDALPPTEDIMADMGPDADRTAVAVAVGGPSTTSEEEAEDTRRRNRSALVALALTGSGLAIALLAFLLMQDRGGAGASPSPSPPAVAASIAPTSTNPAASPSASAGATATVRPTPTLAPTQTLAPSTPAVSTLPPLTQLPATGDSLGLATFNRTSGTCPFADTFQAAFHLESSDGEATLTQFPEEHISTGTLTRDSASGGLLITNAAGQDYNTTVAGNTVDGTYTDSSIGCNDVYDLHLLLDRPLLAPPPFGSAPALFSFLDQSGNPVLDLPTGVPVRISVESYGDPVILDLLPIRVEMHVGDDTPWSFTIGNGSGDDTLCVDPTACSADAPSPADPAWFAHGSQPVLIAFASGGDDVLAVYAPNDIDWTQQWAIDLIALPD